MNFLVLISTVIYSVYPLVSLGHITGFGSETSGYFCPVKTFCSIFFILVRTAR